MNFKRVINLSLHKFGYQLQRVDSDPAFTAQRNLVPQARMIFDVGANVGQTSAKYASLYPGATIHAFEPFPASFERLTQSRVAGMHPHRLAVSNKTGTQALKVYEGSVLNSFLDLSANAPVSLGPSAQPTGSVEVPTITLDSFAQQHGIGRIDILKLDVQGVEPLVLEGARELLSKRLISVIYTEVMFASQYENQTSFDELWRQVRALGYVLYGIYNLESNTNSYLNYGDAIFVSPDFQIPVRNHRSG